MTSGVSSAMDRLVYCPAEGLKTLKIDSSIFTGVTIISLLYFVFYIKVSSLSSVSSGQAPCAD